MHGKSRTPAGTGKFGEEAGGLTLTHLQN